jgi:hypothetical protein
MITFKQKFNEAVESVLDELDSLSIEELKAKIDTYKDDERTSSLFYAWNGHVSKSGDTSKDKTPKDF